MFSDPHFVEHEPVQPQFVSGIASCEIIDEVIYLVFYTDRPHIVDGRLTTEKVLSGSLAMPLKAYLTSRLMTQAALAANIVETAPTAYN